MSIRRWKMLGSCLSLLLAGVALPAAADPSFVPTGSLAEARRSHTATLLASGKVLIAGGWNGTTLGSAELYDPATATVAATGALVLGRTGHSATALPSGMVLIAGGQDADGVYLSSAEIYDPASGAFTPTGPLSHARRYHTATLLPSGQVLMVGGTVGVGYVAEAELYDPASGTFTSTAGPLATARYQHTATLLASGRVLIAGGANSSRLSSAELYDPGSSTFSATGSLSTVRFAHTATTLPSGRVLVAGGMGPGSYLSSAEVYDPAAGTFSSTGSLVVARYQQSATLLPSGRVLVTGGHNLGGRLSSAELYDPASGTFTVTAPLATARHYHTATLLPSGRVLVGGGSGDSGYLSSFESFDPAMGTFASAGVEGTARAAHTATPLPSGEVLVAGGMSGGGHTNLAELYDPASGSFAATGSLGSARSFHTATLLPAGTVLVTGGYNGTNYLSGAELYDPAPGTFTTTGALGAPRAQHTATLLPSGKVLIAGGYDGANCLTSAALYDPASGAFAATGSLGVSRAQHTATLLPSGKVLIAGGYDGINYLSSAELYDPLLGTFTATNPLASARARHSATLLPSGTVLIAGGANLVGALTNAEYFDPASGTFTTTGSLTTARESHAAALLPSGKVLIAGGNDGANYLSSAELYDDASRSFTTTGALSAARGRHSATSLRSGKTLIAGGADAGGSLGGAELYDEGLGYQDAWRPVVSSLTDPAELGSGVSASGLLFSGSLGNGPEGSTGTTQGSSANYPLLQLRRIDNDQTLFLPLDPVAGFSATSFSSSANWSVSPGPAMATVFTNGMPSTAQYTMVCSPLSGVSISVVGGTSVCGGSATGGTVTVADTGGVPSAHEWGYRTTPAGPITTIGGQSGTSYTIKEADFSGPGVYYLVAVTNPLCGSPIVSNELSITINSSAPTVTSNSPVYVGADLQLGASSGPGLTYSWAGPNGFASTDQNPLIPSVTTAAAGTYSVTSALAGCTSAAGSTTVTIDPHTLSISGASITEGDSGHASMVFPVTLSTASAVPVSVNYSTRAGTAAPSLDYVAKSGTLTFSPGTTLRYVGIDVVGDAISEATETLHVDLASASGARIVASDGLGTILDNDHATLSAADASITEGAVGSVPLVFTVTLSPPSGLPVTVHYATADGTATAVADYTSTAGDLTFAPGETSKAISVPVNGDAVSEADETFQLRLSSPVNASVLRNGAGTIVNDDAAPQISISDVSLTEDDYGTKSAVFTVTLSAPSGQVVQVSYATADGTALVGSDYSAKSGTLLWSAGTSTPQTIVVPVINDLLSETPATESFVVNLTSPVYASLVDGQGVGTITDNDAAWPVLSVSDPAVTEGNSGTKWVAFTVSLSTPSPRPMLVTFATVAATATAGADYVARSGSLSFNTGDTSKLVYVYTVGDTVAEGTETFLLRITSASGATFGDDGVCTILDND